MEFEWDPSKAAGSFQKHGVTFKEAASVFRDPLSITIFDSDHSEEEDRFLTVGYSARRRPLIVAHMERASRTRIITARELTRAERNHYENEIQRRRR